MLFLKEMIMIESKLIAMVALTASALAISSCSKSTNPVVPTEKSGKLVLTDATIVDTSDGHLSPHMDIFMAAGRIDKIAPTADLTLDPSVTVVNASGKYVVPGYLDMHAHVFGNSDAASSLSLMLINGVTGFRQMQGSKDLLAARRDGTLPNAEGAPELLAIPGEILTPLNAGAPKEVIAEVRRQKEQGADFIKVVNVSVPVFFAAQAEAKKLNLPFVGHVPGAVDALVAARNGMRSMEHLGTGVSLLTPCSADEASLRAAVEKIAPPSGPPIKLPFMSTLFASKIRRFLVNPTVESEMGDINLMQQAVATFDTAKCAVAAQKLFAADTWQVPTLIRLRTMELGDSPEYLSDPRYAYMPPEKVKLWVSVAHDFTTKFPAATKANFAAAYATQLRMVKLFDEAGVKMLTGSDDGGGWLVPGYSLHQEFDELSRAGLSPLKILQMATKNGAEFLGKQATMGSVTIGKNADLVMLNANPVESEKNLHQISGVVRRGNFYSKASLDSILGNLSKPYKQ